MKIFCALLLMGVCVLGDLDAWNSGTNSNIRVGGIVAQSITNTARTASTFVVAGTDKADSSTATSTMLAATLSDETGTGVSVFNSGPTFTNGVNVATGQILVPDGTSAAPSIGFTTSTNMGFYKSGTGQLSVSVAGSQNALFYATGFRTIPQAIELGDTDGTIKRNGLYTIQFGVDAASPNGYFLKGANGSGTDKNAGSLTVEGGQSTGTGRGGDLVFRTSITTNSASALNFYSTRAYQSAKFVDLTDATTNLLFKCSLATNNYCGGGAIVTLYISNGTDFKVHTSNISWSAVNKAGTITGQVVEAAQLENHVETAGTAIADTYTLVQDASNNTFYISVTPTQGTVITPSVYRAKWVITALNSNDPATITPP